MENSYHNTVSSKYYNIEKTNLLKYFDGINKKILDIGCANGRLGKKLQELNIAVELVGVEIFLPAAKEAKKHYNNVIVGDIEEINLPYEKYFDYIICGDIIEHLKNPWVMLKNIRNVLKIDGKLICSVPNIRYWRILRDLIIHGKWEYVDSGILDITHLRFFTKYSFIELLKCTGYKICLNEMCIGGPKQDILNRMSLNIFEEYLSPQFIIVAKIA